MNPTVLIVATAAVYSLTLLIVCDKITDRPRQRLLTRISGHGYAGRILGLDPATQDPGAVLGYRCACDEFSLSVDGLLDHVHDARQQVIDQIPMTRQATLLYLLRCPWCTSLWVALPVMWSAWCFGDRAWWFIPAVALAARGVAGTWASYANPRK